jgi:hypothetical protein
MSRRNLLRERWALPLIGLVGLGAGIAIGIAASGDGETETATTTVVSTRTAAPGGERVRTVRRRGRTRTRTVVRTQTVTVAGSGGGSVAVPTSGSTFSGRNGKTIGTVRIPRRSAIRWTNDGEVFTVLSERQIHVSSNKSSGSATIERGTYPEFRVAAIGRWTIRITPR